MKTEHAILKTKLTPPQIKKYMLQRSALTRKLKRIVDYPLTIVHSGPGYGKSTALSAFAGSAALPCCWYTVSPHDDDLVPFVTYIVYALRQAHPEFAGGLLDRLHSGAKFTRDSDIESLGEAFINELVLLEAEHVLVVDDFHLVEHSASIDLFLQFLLRYMPSRLRLVLSGRTRPKWDLLTTMRVRGDLLELTEADLAFSEEEIEVLFTDNYEYPLEREAIRRIYARTEGWVIAIQLIWQRLLAGGDLTMALHGDTSTTDDLFRFLALEVFQKQPDDIRAFLLQTSVLEEVSGELCDAIFGRGDSQVILRKIGGQSLFLTQTGERQYRYHALFKDFLLGELKKEPDVHAALRRQAADYFAANGKPELAIAQYDAIGESGEAARLLAAYGRQMIDAGQLESLLQRIRRIPEQLRDERYELWIHEGDVLRYRSSYEKALTCYMKGFVLAERAGDRVTQSVALEGQARIYLDTIQPGKAEALLKRSIELLEDNPETYGAQLLRLYSLMAENLINAGRSGEAEQWYSRCRTLEASFQDELFEARLHLRTGRLQQMRRDLERARLAEAEQGEQPIPRSHRETDILLAFVEVMLGNPDRAKQLAESGMMQGIRLKSPFVEACGWMRMGHAAQLMAKYDFGIADNCYKTSLEIMDQLDVSRGKAEPLMGMCLLYGREGMYDLAMQYGRDALSETEKVSDVWLSSYIRMSMGVACYYARRYAESAAIFAESQDRFLHCGDSFGVTVSLFWQTMIAYQLEQEEHFALLMDRLLRMVQAGEYDFLLQRRTLSGPSDIVQVVPLLIEAQRLDIQSHYVSYLLSGLGMEHMTYHPGYTLRIETLGGFRVWLGDRELGDKDWQRGKAKELFQLLVVRRQRLVPKEEILAVLFDGADEKAAARDFKVALNALNTALEPNRRARSNPFFIQRHGTSYGLNLAAGFELDSVDFESLIKAGLEEMNDERAKRYLEKGLLLYRGDFLPDRLYDDWCIEERERLQVLYLRGAERLARLFASTGQYDGAIRWCEEMLQKDSCWEEAYRLLMHCHYQLGNRNQAIKWYQKCSKALDAELGIEPMPATRELYELVVS